MQVVALVVVGVVAGIVSTVVSLASVISYPALLALGLPPVAANVSNTVSLVFTGIGSTAGSRPELRGLAGTALRLGAVTACGGATGAALLLMLPERTFALVVPLLVASASLLLLVQPRWAARVGAGPRRVTPWLLLALFAAAVYVGYFGAAGGVVLLVVLGAMLDLPLVRVNAVKNVVSAMANAVAATAFVLLGPVVWSVVVPLSAGFLVGGWVGPSIARRLAAATLRLMICGCGLAVAAVLAWRTY